MFFRFNLVFVFLFFLFTSCEDKTEDYRQIYVGEYNFVTAYEEIDYDTYETTTTWLNFPGNIQKDEKNRVLIRFLDHVDQPLSCGRFNIAVHGEINPIIDEYGELIYTEFNCLENSHFNGHFYSKDSVIIHFGLKYSNKHYTYTIKGNRQ